MIADVVLVVVEQHFVELGKHLLLVELVDKH